MYAEFPGGGGWEGGQEGRDTFVMSPQARECPGTGSPWISRQLSPGWKNRLALDQVAGDLLIGSLGH